MDKPIRSIAKSLTWRVVASTVAALIVFAATGSIQVAGIVLAADVTVKFILMYLHERAWNLTKWGQE